MIMTILTNSTGRSLNTSIRDNHGADMYISCVWHVVHIQGYLDRRRSLAGYMADWLSYPPAEHMAVSRQQWTRSVVAIRTDVLPWPRSPLRIA